MALKVNLANISQGHADVLVDGKKVGFVEQGAGWNSIWPVWYAYDITEKRLSSYGDPKRAGAVLTLVENT